MCVSLVAKSGCGYVKVEQRVEPTRKAAQIIHKKLSGCLQSQQGLDSERRMVIISFSVSVFSYLNSSNWEETFDSSSQNSKKALIAFGNPAF